jgi:hypothetical protein
MRTLMIVIACLLTGGCHPRAKGADERRITDSTKLAELRKAFVPEAYLRAEDQRKAELLSDGYSAPMPCVHEKMELGAPVVAGLPLDQCFKMTKPQQWQGLWRNDFEGSQFCAAPANRCPENEPTRSVWLHLATPVPGAEDTPPGGLYAIDFIGRKTAYSGVYDGGASEEIMLDHLISIKEVERPAPGQMTKEHVQAYRKDCDDAQICMPNSEVPNRN